MSHGPDSVAGGWDRSIVSLPSLTIVPDRIKPRIIVGRHIDVINSASFIVDTEPYTFAVYQMRPLLSALNPVRTT